MTTAGERWRWDRHDSAQLDAEIVGERQRQIGRSRRSTHRCSMELHPWGNRRFRCRKPAVHGSRYCVKHLGGQ